MVVVAFRPGRQGLSLVKAGVSASGKCMACRGGKDDVAISAGSSVCREEGSQLRFVRYARIPANPTSSAKSQSFLPKKHHVDPCSAIIDQLNGNQKQNRPKPAAASSFISHSGGLRPPVFAWLHRRARSSAAPASYVFLSTPWILLQVSKFESGRRTTNTHRDQILRTSGWSCTYDT
jgi:hypothetical protein